jgi:perosamine synthetase
MDTKMKRITEKERAYVAEVLDSEFRSSAGSNMTGRLERKFAEVYGVKYAISFINGTATLHTALLAAGVYPGDEVIVPPLTMASTTFAVLQANAVPVFADIDPDTFTIDPADTARKVTPRTKAIMPVALYGLSPDMDPIMEIAEKHKLAVIEDDAECLLGYYKGKLVGTIGQMASFSFQSSKQMTSGEGGMVITNDEELADRVRRIGSLGYAMVKGKAGKGKITKDTIQDPEYERHSSMGWNYRMPELCAAVALAQTERLQELIARRIEVANLYAEAIKGCRWLVPQAVPEGYVHSYWTYVLKLENNGEFSWHDFRKKYMEMGGDGIYAAWQLNYLEPVFRNIKFPGQKYERGICPAAESIQPKLLQFKTNYMDMSIAGEKAEVLARTIKYFRG